MNFQKLRYQLYEGPVEVVSDPYIEVIDFDSDSEAAIMAAVKEHSEDTYKGRDIDQCLTIKDTLTGKYYRPSEFEAAYRAGQL